MPSGIKIKDIVLGTGEEAIRGKTVAANVRMFLNQGTELTDTLAGGQRRLIDLGKRDCIAGVRYGLEGMRVGGRRDLKISPHLAYGAEGVPGHVPPNAVIRCEVELLDVREPGVREPEDYPAGKHLYVFRPGEASRDLPRWQFGLKEDGHCGALVTHPIRGMPWRHTRHSQTEAHLEPTTAAALFEEVLGLPDRFPAECLVHGQLWADMTERGNSITRDNQSNVLCITIGVLERGEWLCHYSMKETSPALLDSRFFRFVNGLVEDHLEKRRQETPNNGPDRIVAPRGGSTSG